MTIKLEKANAKGVDKNLRTSATILTMFLCSSKVLKSRSKVRSVLQSWECNALREVGGEGLAAGVLAFREGDRPGKLSGSKCTYKL